MSRPTRGRVLRQEWLHERHLWAGVSVESVDKSKLTFTEKGDVCQGEKRVKQAVM